MAAWVGYLLLFVATGFVFIFAHLVAGKFFRPARPDAEKLTIYECGEPTIGSAWVQFDLRFYVVALLFVIFDVEVAFFFPWAVVFGKANTLANLPTPQTDAERAEYRTLVQELVPDYPEYRDARRQELTEDAVARNRQTAHELAWLALVDIVVFFGVLLVGFAYLWKRGDLNWVRSLAAEEGFPTRPAGRPATAEVGELVGAGRP
jgi:NADH-quinone oxidoreductase subunit A